MKCIMCEGKSIRKNVGIPKEIAEFLRLDKGKEVNVFPESKQVLSVSISNLL